VLDIGDSNLVNGETAEYARVVDMNRQLAAQGKDLVVYQRLLMGITKALYPSATVLSKLVLFISVFYIKNKKSHANLH
jgi:DNA-directed RNA polymerase subunit beta'